MSISHLIKYGLSLPPHIAAAKALGMLKNRVFGLWLTKARALETTYIDLAPTSPSDLKSSVHKNHTTDTKSALTKKMLAHEFNLLGSGWTLGGFNLVIDSSAYNFPVSEGTIWWDGSAGTRYFIDPVQGTVIVIMAQISPSRGGGFREDFTHLVDAAITERR